MVCPMGEVGADPIELARLAATFLHASQRMGDALRATRAQVTPPTTAYGDTPGAGRLHTANDLAVEQAGLAMGRLVEVLEGDVDRLYRLVFAYEMAERQARAKIPRNGPQP